jgi:hypothetical protein
MEQLHASVPQPQQVPSHPLEDAAKRILLLDCDNRRRELRAEALICRGVLVDHAAVTGVARSLWKPGMYDLVLIELSGIDGDCAAFIAFIQGVSGRQKFGFYVAQAPYVTASAEECRSSLEGQKLHPGVAKSCESADPRRGPGTGLIVAARKIAALRHLARVRAVTRPEPYGADVRDEPPRGSSASEAVRLAGRLLGGS